MYYFLTEAVKRRFIFELRRFWQYHPKYQDIVDNIQGKYSFKERPHTAIVLTTSSANTVQLSADNFMSTVEEYVSLYRDLQHPGLSIEWVREDAVAIQDNGGQFPSPPGLYYITVERVPGTTDRMPAFQFYVDPKLDIWGESLLKQSPTEWVTQQPFIADTLQLFVMPGNRQLVAGVNYTSEPSEGLITLTQPLASGQFLSADYRYQGERTGPWKIIENNATRAPIPGVVLVFGRRVQDGDQLAVQVLESRQQVALEYGGRWEISLDFEIIADDPYAQQEISDLTVMYLFAVARPRLSTEGIEISTVSMGGESEEVADETGDTYFYKSSVSLTVNTDWFVQVPLNETIRRLSTQTPAQIETTAGMSELEVAHALPNDVQGMQLMRALSPQYQDPMYVIGNQTYPR